MNNEELLKKIELLEQRLKMAESHINSLSKAVALQPHPAVINSLIQQNQGGSIFDGLF